MSRKTGLLLIVPVIMLGLASCATTSPYHDYYRDDFSYYSSPSYYHDHHSYPDSTIFFQIHSGSYFDHHDDYWLTRKKIIKKPYSNQHFRHDKKLKDKKHLHHRPYRLRPEQKKTYRDANKPVKVKKIHPHKKDEQPKQLHSRQTDKKRFHHRNEHRVKSKRNHDNQEVINSGRGTNRHQRHNKEKTGKGRYVN